jgi:hypothetical protein
MASDGAVTTELSEAPLVPAGPAPDSTARWRPWWAVPLSTWLASRVAMVLLGLAAAWTVQSSQLGATTSFTAIWDRWDVELFRKAAQYGWFSRGSDPHQAVDFPGLPLTMRLLHPVAGSWIVAGLLISALAGVATCLALYRLAARDDPAETSVADSVTGRRAVVYLVVFPYAVFLFAGYSEGLFLAFVTTSWLAAKQQRWVLATVLAAGATGTRITGIAFFAALIVEYLVSRHKAGRIVDRHAPLLVLPALPVVAYFAYLHHHTGRWNEYADETRAGWGRGLANPLHGWRTTWHVAFAHGQSADFAWFWRAELLAVVVALALTIALLAQRRWGEATYTGVTFLMMACTNYYGSGVRSVLVLFPMYLLLARLSERRPWLHGALLWIMAPLMAALTVAFAGGAWLD